MQLSVHTSGGELPIGGDALGDACFRQTRCSDCTVRKCSYFVANTSAQLLLQLVYGRHSSHDIVGAGMHVTHEY